MRRAAALWLLLFGVYAATIGLDAFGNSDYGGDEPHYLLAAESIVEDADVDVKDEFAERAYEDFYPYELDRHGRETEGRLNEPHGVGFPLLIAPAYALGGEHGVELFLAAIAALAVALGYLLAVRVVPDPWALGAALAVGLSPPFIAYGTAVYPELSAAAALAGAALLAARLEERVRRRTAFGCLALLGMLPWLGTKFVPAGVVIGVFAVRSVLRARRRTLAVGSAELALFSAALYVGLNEALYGGPTPYAADVEGETATDASLPGGYLARAYRLGGAVPGPRLRPAALGARVPARLRGAVDALRSRRDGLSRAVPDLRAGERVALMCAAALGAQLLVAAFLAPTMFGFWFPPRHLLAALPLAMPLVAWGLRRLPRTGTVLALLVGRGLGLALLRRSARRRRARHAAARRPVRAAHGGIPVVRRLRVAVCARRGARRGASWPSPSSRRGTGASARAPPDAGTRGSARRSGRPSGGRRRPAPPPVRCPRPTATA